MLNQNKIPYCIFIENSVRFYNQRETVVKSCQVCIAMRQFLLFLWQTTREEKKNDNTVIVSFRFINKVTVRFSNISRINKTFITVANRRTCKFREQTSEYLLTVIVSVQIREGTLRWVPRNDGRGHSYNAKPRQFFFFFFTITRRPSCDVLRLFKLTEHRY